MKLLRAIPTLVVVLCACQWVAALEVSPEETAEAKRWVAAKFDGKPQPRPDLGYLLPKLKSGALQRNARQGHPLKIAAETFPRGIHCPSKGTIQVHLPAPGKRFTAAVGVDSNDISYYSSLGRSQVVVALEAGGKRLFETPVMHEGLAAIAVDVDLGGASDFTLLVTGKESAIDWDQVDFANAKVTLRDGPELALESLPTAPLSGNYTADPVFSFEFGGKKSTDFLKQWTIQRSSREIDPRQTEHTQTYHDPKTGLEIRMVGVEYHEIGRASCRERVYGLV